MITRKLYYEDCHIHSFSATVTGCTFTKKGFAVILDATAFYPEGGGQACDLGTLGDANVLAVFEQGEDILHLCDKPLTVGQTVSGVLDWERRFDLMQQHTGEHIVSGIVHQMFGGHNVGFHVGADGITIDFDVPIPPEKLPEIEKAANKAVFQNLPVTCHIPDKDRLSQCVYRSKRALPWPVRLVEIPGYDTCACCGVHVAYTGEIGIIKLLSCCKFHEGVRIEMVCGGRALALLSDIFEQNRLVSQAFSAKILETGAAAKRMNEILSAEKFRSAGLEKQLFTEIGKGFYQKDNVLYFAEALAPGSIRNLAEAISQNCNGIAAVFSGNDKDGYQLCLASKNGDVHQAGKTIADTLKGRGGGKPGFFQGSIRAGKTQIVDFFRNRLSQDFFEKL